MKKILILHQRLIQLAFLLIFVFANTACGGKKSGSSSDRSDITVESVESKRNVIEEVSEYPLPTSFEVTKLLIEAGASYILDLSNPVSNVDQYINLKSKALNLGVYGADLSYAATYNQTQETMQYLNTCAQLIDELQIESFDEELVRSVEANIDNVDSLIILISDAFYETYEFLQTNVQDELAILVVAGSWIEAFYITTQISLIARDNAEIVSIIADQRDSLEKLIEVMEPVKENEMASDLYRQLNGLKGVFQASGGTLNQSQLDSLVSLTETMRAGIIS